MPIIIKYFIKLPEPILFSEIPINTPIKSEPRTLTKKVPIGRFG